MPDPSIREIDDLLPQTQCTQCGFDGCLPYATALAAGETDINRCPPGGESTITALSVLLGKPFKSLDPECGQTIERHIAVIQPEHCIGCTLCIKACPVDAIIGTNKKRHAVLAQLCTGCELCIPPCPVDCIDMVYMPEHSQWERNDAYAARQRMQTRETRIQRQTRDNNQRLEAKAINKLDNLVSENNPEADRKRSVIEAALARARARRKAENS